jgi:hypothetical protein
MADQSAEFNQLVRDVCEAARKGLVACYGFDGQSLPYTRLPSSNWSSVCPSAKARYSVPYTKIPDSSDVYRTAGKSMRYAAIAQIGITRWVEHHKGDAGCLPDLWCAIVNESRKRTHVSDLSLALWAGVIGERDGCDHLARMIREVWRNHAEKCNAYELAWVVQACAEAQLKRRCRELALCSIGEKARNMLVALFCPSTGLFQRHHRMGLTNAVGRRIACFADQVYPILALSTYGVAFEDDRCVQFGGCAVEEICRLQGSLGQWYPVYSVHQDGMAPMAIFASDRATGNDHTYNVNLGLLWLAGKNELGEDLLRREEGMVWRDIHRRELPRAGRFLRGICWTAGLRLGRRSQDRSTRGFRVNYECRPYHLGWILYAWADRNALIR